MGDNAKSVTLSLYQRHIDKVHKHRADNKLSSDAGALQNIIDNYNVKKHVGMKKDIVILIIYPVILCLFSLYGATSMQKVIDKLVAKGYTDLGTLLNLEAIYSSLGFVTLGILAMCMIVFFGMVKKQYGD